MNYVTDEDKKIRKAKHDNMKTKLADERKKFDDIAEEFKI